MIKVLVGQLEHAEESYLTQAGCAKELGSDLGREGFFPGP